MKGIVIKNFFGFVIYDIRFGNNINIINNNV